MVLSSASSVYPRRAARAQRIFTLHTDVGGLSRVALKAERPLRQADAVALALPARVAHLEAVVAEELHAILTAHEGCLGATLRTHSLLNEYHRRILAVAARMR